mmetsp:Transcript_28950/g.43730  ORF Transcript_28950/g.43730 Transcript_28950/m.43730 type:complete len:474 (-) Transcript_28950:183-1604(-)
MVLERLPSIDEDEDSIHGLGRYENTSWDEDMEDDIEEEERRRKKKKKKKLRDLEKEKNEPEVDPLAELMMDGSVSVSSVEDFDDNDGSIDLNNVDFEELEALATGVPKTDIRVGGEPVVKPTYSAYNKQSSKLATQKKPKRVTSINRDSLVQNNVGQKVRDKTQFYRSDSGSSEEFDVDTEISKNKMYDGPDAIKASDTFIPVVHKVTNSTVPREKRHSSSTRQRNSGVDLKKPAEVTVKRLVLTNKKGRSDSSQVSSFGTFSQGSFETSSQGSFETQGSFEKSSQNASRYSSSQGSSYEITPKVAQYGGRGQYASQATGNRNHTHKIVNSQHGGVLVAAGQQYYVPRDTKQAGTFTLGIKEVYVKEVAGEEEEEKGCSRGAVCGCLLLAVCAVGIALFLYVYVFGGDNQGSQSPPTSSPSSLSSLPSNLMVPEESTQSSSPSLRTPITFFFPTTPSTTTASPITPTPIETTP